MVTKTSTHRLICSSDVDHLTEDLAGFIFKIIMAFFKLDVNGDDDVSDALQVHMIKAGGCLRQSRKRFWVSLSVKISIPPSRMKRGSLRYPVELNILI